MNYCGRNFNIFEIEAIRALLETEPKLTRYKLSIKVCETLDWRRPDGQLKDMSCRVALLRMEANGLFKLPPPKCAKPVAYIKYPDIESAAMRPMIEPSVNLSKQTVDL